MDFGEKDIRRISIIILVAALVIVAFFVVKPFLLSILGGLLLAYIFMPLYRKINKYVKNKSAAASLVSFIIVLGIIAVIWVVAPILIKQAFELLISIQKIDMQSGITKIFPTASPEFVAQMALTLNSAIITALAGATSFLTSILTNLAKLLLDFLILGFVFFFSLRDSERLERFIRGISPLNESKEKIVIKHFKDMTSSVIYGWVAVGILQGILAGIGFYIFGVDNALALTIAAIFFSVIPFLGPVFIWLPVGIYLIVNEASTYVLIGYFLYNLLIVSLADNLIRSYIISRRTKVPAAVVLIGMVGGLFVFGIVGIIIGPLILAYLLTLLESFKDKSIYSLFS